MTRLLVFLAVLLLVVVAVTGLRNATMTDHTRMPPGSQLVVDATARWKGTTRAAANRTRALVYACVAESSPRADLREFRWRRHGGFEFRIAPALDEPDQRQLDGCLSDLRMPRLLVTVDRMHALGTGGGDR